MFGRTGPGGKGAFRTNGASRALTPLQSDASSLSSSFFFKLHAFGLPSKPLLPRGFSPASLYYEPADGVALGGGRPTRRLEDVELVDQLPSKSRFFLNLLGCRDNGAWVECVLKIVKADISAQNLKVVLMLFLSVQHFSIDERAGC